MNLKSSLVRGASATLVMRVASMGLSWATAVVLARMLGVGGYGTYAFLISIITVLRLPATFGTPSLLMRETSAARATGRWGRMRGVSLWALRFSLVTSVPVVLAVAAALVFFPDKIPDNLEPSLPWAATLIVLLPLAGLRGGVLRGLKQVVWGHFPEQIVRPLFILLFVFLPFLWGQTTDRPQEAMIANALATAVAWFAGALLVMKYWPAEARGVTPEYDGKAWRKSLLPLGLGNAMYLLDGEVAVLALGLVATKADVGVFKAAGQFALLAGLGYSVVNVNISPRIAAAWAKDDMAKIQATVTQGSRLSMLYCLPVALGLAALGGWGVPFVMGPGFEGAWLPLSLLALGHVINAAFGSATSVLIMTKHEKFNTVAFAIGLAVNIGLTLLLTPMFGPAGAASAVVASVTARNLILWAWARRRLGIETGFWGTFGRPPAAQG
jgi:O-antigen/teichoic acid export membrane protein